jgi:aminoglycoside N3'-acetyltransferase
MDVMSDFIEDFSRFIAEKTAQHPMVIHINPIGLFRLGRNNKERFENFNSLLLSIEKYGGNILIPTYSYSYSSNELYNPLETPSKLDAVSEYLRQNHATRRTFDPHFSYIQFGSFFKEHHYAVRDHNSFGIGSLLDELFKANGYLASLGNIIGYWTEVHYLEQKLDIPYRFNKSFKGITKFGNDSMESMITFYCRNHTFNLGVDLSLMANDLVKEERVEFWKNDLIDFQFEVMKFQDLYTFIQTKVEDSPYYLCIDKNKKRSY